MMVCKFSKYTFPSEHAGAYPVKSGLREVRLMSHQSDYSLLDICHFYVMLWLCVIAILSHP